MKAITIATLIMVSCTLAKADRTQQEVEAAHRGVQTFPMPKPPATQQQPAPQKLPEVAEPKPAPRAEPDNRGGQRARGGMVNHPLSGRLL